YHDHEGGPDRWSMVRSVPVIGEGGRVQFAVTVTQDVTELRNALDEVTTALATRQRFLSVASHELRTPLTALKGQLQLVQRRLARGIEGEVLAGSIAAAGRQVDRLSRLVGELLDVSRLAEGRFAVDPEPLDPTALLQRVVQQERELEPERPLELRLGELPAF